MNKHLGPDRTERRTARHRWRCRRCERFPAGTRPGACADREPGRSGVDAHGHGDHGCPGAEAGPKPDRAEACTGTGAASPRLSLSLHR